MSNGERARRVVTRRDVARAAGVSDAVVTYTLNGGAPVAPATAARVLAAVAELGYRPNQAARALKSGSARTLALVIPDATNPFFAELAHAVEAAAIRRGFALYMTTSPSEHPVTLQRFQEFASRQVDGVLLVPGHSRIDTAELGAVGIPWALLAASTVRAGVASFGVDLHRGAGEATAHLVADGRRCVGFLGDTAEHDERQRGWREALADAGLEPGPAVFASFDRESGYGAVDAVLAAEPRPDAVFVASDMIAVGALRRLHELGVRVPDELALVSFDGSWESDYSWPRLTVVRQPVEVMAERAVEHLVKHPRPGVPEAAAGDSEATCFAGTLVVRDSCGPHPGGT